MKEDSLADIYGKNNHAGVIRLTPDGLEIQGKKFTNVINEPIVIERFGENTIVECRFICEEFLSVPKHLS